MPGAPVFDANWKIDAVDFQRQLDEARSAPVGEEIKALITGRLDAESAMRDARVRALMVARKKLVAAIWAKWQEIQDNNWLPSGASDAVDAWLDEGPLKVKP